MDKARTGHSGQRKRRLNVKVTWVPWGQQTTQQRRTKGSSWSGACDIILCASMSHYRAQAGNADPDPLASVGPAEGRTNGLAYGKFVPGATVSAVGET